MTDAPIITPEHGLSEPARIVNTFVAPSATFNDIRRSAMWWGPVLLMLIVGIFFSNAVDKKVGFETVAHQQMQKMASVAEKIDALPPDQRAAQYAAAGRRTKYQSYGFLVIGLPFVALLALLYWASLNFGLGANAKYSQILAVVLYSGLPKLFIFIIAGILLFAGVGVDNFDIQNPAGTNLGYFLPNTMPAMKAAGSFLDVFGLWALALLVMGTATVTGKKPSQTAIVVVGWWLLGLVLMVGIAAAFS